MRTMIGTAFLLALTSACSSLGVPPAHTAPRAPLEAGPAVRVDRVRVLAKDVNVGRPLEIDEDSSGIAITYGTRGHDDQRVVIDPVTLEPYAPLDPVAADLGGYALPTRRARTLALGDGRVLDFFMLGNVDYGYRLFVGTHDDSCDSAAHGLPEGLFQPPRAIEVAPGSSEALGSVQATRLDDSHALVAFYSSDHDEIDLMVARVEAWF